jgi:hypothetical protein
MEKVEEKVESEEEGGKGIKKWLTMAKTRRRVDGKPK